MNLLRSLLVLFVLAASAQTWVEGEIGFRLTIIPVGSPADRAGLKVGDILADPPGVRPILLSHGKLPVFRFDAAKGAYAQVTVPIAFRGNEEKRLGVTGDLGYLVTRLEPGSLADRAKLQLHDFLPQLDDHFVHEPKDLTLPEKGEVRLHVTRWNRSTRSFEKLILPFTR